MKIKYLPFAGLSISLKNHRRTWKNARQIKKSSYKFVIQRNNNNFRVIYCIDDL